MWMMWARAALEAGKALGGRLLPYWHYAAIGLLALLCWHFQSRAVANADTAKAQAASFAQAQKDANAQWEQKLSNQKAKSEQDAKETQSDYETRLAQYASATDRYIASHRTMAVPVSLWPAPIQSGGGPTEGTAKAGNSPGASDVPEGIVVAASDVQRCSEWQNYGVTAHDWIMRVGQPTQPVP
jgi:hypothetical protein